MSPKMEVAFASGNSILRSLDSELLPVTLDPDFVFDFEVALPQLSLFNISP
jgi:hypothetical protein